MKRPLLIIIMGSQADEGHCREIAEAARVFGLEVVQRVGSAHKTAQHLLEMLGQYESDPRPKVYITVAGRSNALSGFIDGAVRWPVIACPPLSGPQANTDIFSSLRMPSGIAPAVVLDPANAALLAAKILGLLDPSIQSKVTRSQERNVEEILAADQKTRETDHDVQ